MALTKLQRKLITEIEHIASSAGQDYRHIEEYEEAARTPKLRIIKKQMIIGDVVALYTLADELLSNVICHVYFKKPGKGFSYKALWRTKKFSAFAYHVLDNLYPLQKMSLIHEIKPVPKNIRDTLNRLNALRNALAHSFFPENRKSYRETKAVTYKDHDIFSNEGFDLFATDGQELIDYLLERAYGVKPDSF
ncbi:hypothetical protein [Bradyrhizobium erythrophlei]|uniref:Uncharacterized protein n=1 Tax=Bradyrhizobium erythrophlei TaxID=1437360 RepID=A0A1M5QF04_9BRAD|nr:hypothetical protein [Bradyrhizobium erythrophlei]SHH12612.1 hypothetical protein SAMN05444169_5889 [Bradyrhizobium erythrophlei]